MLQTILLTLLALLASASSLLTFAHLWQVKEWRIDRLLEHLRREGVLRQLFGVSRPALLGGFAFLGAVGILPWGTLTPLVLLGITVVNAAQILLHRQPRPVWTRKAIVLCSTSLLLTATVALLGVLGSFGVLGILALPLLPFLQPLFLALSWLFLLPIDAFLKQRILARARELRSERSDLVVIGITGSVGKSTTKELLRCLLADRGILATPAYVNSEVGVASFLCSALQPEHRILVCEMGAYRGGEISTLCRVVRPQIGVVTFIGQQHLALFGSLDALRRAKGELIEALPSTGRAFLNGDCEACVPLRERGACPVTIVGTGGWADLEAWGIEETDEGIRFEVSGVKVFVPIPGTHHVANVLLAVAVATHLGIRLEECAARLRSFRPLPETFRRQRGRGGCAVLNDTRNASPESMRAAIAWAKGVTAKRKILITAGLIELGEAEDRIHEDLGALSQGVFQEVVILDAHSRSTFERRFGKEVRSRVSEQILHDLGGGDLICCIGRLPPLLLSAILRP